MTNSVAIVGFGRFGRTLYRLLRDDFPVTIYNRSAIDESAVTLNKNTKIAGNLKEVYKCRAVFYAVPISEFEKVIREHKKYFRDDHLLIDVLSVKLHSKRVFERYLKNLETQALLTHPMFGPDSSKKGFEGLPIVMDKFRAENRNYDFWKIFFRSKGLRVIEMTADRHDRLAADSQGLTHFIGRLLSLNNFRMTEIDTLGDKILQQVMEQTCNDSWKLFHDLETYNPYAKKMRKRLGEKFDLLSKKLLPKRTDKKLLIFGIQGGRGSFNEEAIFYYLKKENAKKFRIKYLYTAESVLKALIAGDIDIGQLAIENKTGGVVDESLLALAKYKVRIIRQYRIKISHALMVRNDADIYNITRIITHPQVLAQCRDNLKKKYPELKLESGKEKFIDQTAIARLLSLGKIPKDTATLGSKTLVKIYNLKMIDDNLQDDQENYTSFIQILRK